MDYRSVRVVSCNEIGDREVSFEMNRTILDWLLRTPVSEHIFVQQQGGGTVWYRKGTGTRAGTKWEYACCEAVEWASQNRQLTRRRSKAKQSELLCKQADMMDMAEKYEVDDWLELVQFRRPDSAVWHTKIDKHFTTKNTYRFALAVVEGKPVFEGDVLYYGDGGQQTYTTDKMFPEKWSWTPPKPKTVTVELRREDAEFLTNTNTWLPEFVNLSQACRKALEEQK